MYGKMKQHLRAELDSLGEAGLYKRERVIVSPQRAAIGVAGGQEVINFCGQAGHGQQRLRHVVGAFHLRHAGYP